MEKESLERNLCKAKLIKIEINLFKYQKYTDKIRIGLLSVERLKFCWNFSLLLIINGFVTF